jgi:hypothetical protein
VTGTVFGGHDVTDMPRYFKPWQQGLPQLRERLQKVEDLKYFSRAERNLLAARMKQLGLSADQPDTLVMWGGSRRVLAVFDSTSLQIRALLIPD